MPGRLKYEWSAFKGLEPGERFQTQYRRHRQSEAGKSPFRRVLHVIVGVAALALGVVLMFTPGPAVLLFLLAGGLFAMQSLAVARALDGTELRARASLRAIRKRFSRHRTALPSSR